MPSLVQNELTTLASNSNSALNGPHQVIHHQPNIDHQIIPYAQFIANFFVQTAVCLIGSLLNLVVCSVFSNKKFVDSVYFYMAALSLADAGVLLSMLPVGLLRCERVYFDFCSSNLFVKLRARLFYFTIHAGYPLSQFFANLSALLTVVLATERYCAMKYYKRNNTRYHQLNARLITLAVTLFTLLINMPYFFVMKVSYSKFPDANGSVFLLWNATENSSSSGNETTNGSYLDSHFTPFGNSWIYSLFSWCVIVLTGFLPFFILCLANVFLLILVNHRPYNHQKPPLRLRAERKLTVLLITVIFLFLFGQLLRAITNKNVYNVFFPERIYNLFRIIGVNISLICHSLNFFVYLGLNRHFRSQLRSPNFFCLSFQKVLKRLVKDADQHHQQSDKYKTACVKFSCTYRTNSTMENVPKIKNHDVHDLDCMIELIAVDVMNDPVVGINGTEPVENVADFRTNAIVHSLNDNTNMLQHKSDTF